VTTPKEIIAGIADRIVDRLGHNMLASEVITTLRAAGYVIVPVEPTPEMLSAMTMQPPTWDDHASRRKWDAALKAVTP
jgi:hypothetical protein